MARVRMYRDKPVPRTVREKIYSGPLAGVTLIGDAPDERAWSRVVRKSLAAMALAGGDGDAISENRIVLIQQMRGWEGLYDENGVPVEFTQAALVELIDRFPLAFTNFAYRLKLGTADAESDARGSVEEQPAEVREGNAG